MMTDEEIHAWDSVTDEAAQHLVDSVAHGAGETLLRGCLRKLMTPAAGDERNRDGLIYQALMCASNAGYECGIRVYTSTTDEPEVSAFIKLPNGVIGMTLLPDFGLGYIAHGDKARETVREFLGE